MTRAAESNAIFGRGIHLYIINMMDILSDSFANGTSIIVAISDKFFKLLVKSYRVRLIGSSSVPSWMIFFSCKRMVTICRTKINTVSLSFWRKFVSAKLTKSWLYSGSCNNFTFNRTVFAIIKLVTLWKKRLSTSFTVFTYPVPRRMICSKYIFRTPNARANERTTLNIWPRRFGFELFTARLTNLNHISPFKGASRFASQYRCLVDTGKTGCV